jgi:hypothetical protein
MSCETMRHAIARSPYKGATYLVHVMLADTVNEAHGNEFWMATTTLAAKTRLTRKTVATALDRMVDDGWLQTLKDRPGTPTLYRYVDRDDVATTFVSPRSKAPTDEATTPPAVAPVEPPADPGTCVTSTQVPAPATCVTSTQVPAPATCVTSTQGVGTQYPGGGYPVPTNTSNNKRTQSAPRGGARDAPRKRPRRMPTEAASSTPRLLDFPTDGDRLAKLCRELVDGRPGRKPLDPGQVSQWPAIFTLMIAKGVRPGQIAGIMRWMNSRADREAVFWYDKLDARKVRDHWNKLVDAHAKARAEEALLVGPAAR